MTEPEIPTSNVLLVWPSAAIRALLRYGHHAADCGFHLALVGCTCGWDTLRARLEDFRDRVGASRE